MTTATIPNLANADTTTLEQINRLVRDHGVPVGTAASIALQIKQTGFQEGRDAALKAVVEMCDGLIMGFKPGNQNG